MPIQKLSKEKSPKISVKSILLKQITPKGKAKTLKLTPSKLPKKIIIKDGRRMKAIMLPKKTKSPKISVKSIIVNQTTPKGKPVTLKLTPKKSSKKLPRRIVIKDGRRMKAILPPRRPIAFDISPGLSKKGKKPKTPYNKKQKKQKKSKSPIDSTIDSSPDWEEGKLNIFRMKPLKQKSPRFVTPKALKNIKKKPSKKSRKKSRENMQGIFNFSLY